MSDGDEKGDSKRKERENGNEFGRKVSRIAVAQICERVGFECFTDSTLEALTDITIRYLCDLGRTATFYANLAGRTECNVFDAIRWLEDLTLSRGFSGVSEVSHHLTGSGAVREIIEYVGSAEELPFAQPVPQFPVIRNPVMTPSFMQMGEMPAFKHIPHWLPALPDPHTYVHTHIWNERATDPREDKIELARQRRKAESSLLSLQQRLVCNGSAAANTSVCESDDVKALRVPKTKNPILVAPLQAGERNLSQVPLPAKLSVNAIAGNHPSVFDTFASAIEAMKGGSCDSGDVAKQVIQDKRPDVRMKFRIGKKILGESLDLSLRNKTYGKTAPWIGWDDEKDDKKRRTGLILRQSMENPQELTQL